MKGKVIKISDHLGFIEYDIDKRISFDAYETNAKLGDEVEFDIIQTLIGNSHETYNQAKIINVSKHYEPTNKDYLKLIIAAKKFDTQIFNLTDILFQYGFEVEPDTTTKITEEQFRILDNHFSTKQDVEKGNVLEEFTRGTVIETQIEKIVHPSLLVLYFPEKKAYLELKNLAWNIARAENVFNNLKEKDTIEVVILENNPDHIIVSRKHLLPKPNETEDWNSLKVGQELLGSIQEVLVNKLIIKTDLDFYGIVNFSSDGSGEYIRGNKLNCILQSKNEESCFLQLAIDLKENFEDEDHFVREDFQSLDRNLISLSLFSKSTYYSFAKEEEKENLKNYFMIDERLFSNAIVFPHTLYLRFGFNSSAWESNFKTSLLPYLNEKPSEKEGLQFLSEQKYWIRANWWIEKKDSSTKNNWIIFNEEICISGFALSETEECDFIITNLTINRTTKKSSKAKEDNLSRGTFLLNSPIKVLSPYDSKPIETKQKELFTQLKNKVEAFEILNRLKKETGTLLREQGLSIGIFDKFLEYQEDIERKGKNNSRIFVDTYRRIPSTKTEIAIEIDVEIDDLCGSESEEGLLVAIKTQEMSHKEDVETELVWFCDAFVGSSNTKTILHLNGLEKSLEDIKSGFFVERKISLKQYQVQREVIRDFFDKKLKLDHIESLLLRPQKIVHPTEKKIEYINKLIEETEKRQPYNNQVKAVKKAVGNNNIFLIQGPPGTGKTTVIAEVVEQLVKQGEKVLVTSQTHIAVDNVLEKIAQNKQLLCIRLGNNQRIKDSLLAYQRDNLIDTYSVDFEKLIDTNIAIVNYLIKVGSEYDFSSIREHLKEIIIDKSKAYTENIKNVLLQKNYDFLDALSDTSFELLGDMIELLNNWKENVVHEKEILIKPLLYKSIDVAFATCIGIRTDREFVDYGLKFDTVIIDEAGKANMSESLAAISMAKKVILVGDQMQLPPYIDGSLLDENDKESFPCSKYGYKFINEDIQNALKTSFFEFLINKIKDGQFPQENIELLNYQHRMHPHIGEFISESFYEGRVKMGEYTHKNTLALPSPFDKEIVFINTASYKDSYESFDGFSAKNDAEAFCISKLIVPKLLDSGVSVTDLAVIAPYKSQVSHIKKALNANGLNSNIIEVSTLDSFQGMEFDVIIFSFTRAASPYQQNKKVGFLDDARRLNVAFSRAKKKLILVGNTKTLTDKRSHYDSLFNYTVLFTRLVSRSKKEEIGNFVNLTDFKDLKTTFELNTSKIKIGESYPCRLKLSLDSQASIGHIFYIDGELEGIFWDKNNEYYYDKHDEYMLYISRIDKEKERVFLSPYPPRTFNRTQKSEFKAKIKKTAYLKDRKVGDIIVVKYKKTIDSGHFFEIKPGFDGFLFDPKSIKKFEKGCEYNMMIFRIDEEKDQVSLSLPK